MPSRSSNTSDIIGPCGPGYRDGGKLGCVPIQSGSSGSSGAIGVDVGAGGSGSGSFTGSATGSGQTYDTCHWIGGKLVHEQLPYPPLITCAELEAQGAPTPIQIYPKLIDQLAQWGLFPNGYETLPSGRVVPLGPQGCSYFGTPGKLKCGPGSAFGIFGVEPTKGGGGGASPGGGGGRPPSSGGGGGGTGGGTPTTGGGTPTPPDTIAQTIANLLGSLGSTPPQDQGVYAVDSSQFAQPQPQGSNGAWLIVIIVVAVAAGGYYYYDKHKKKAA